MDQWAFLSQTNKTKGKEKMDKKTNSDIKKLKQLATEYRNYCKEGKELEKSIVKFFKKVKPPSSDFMEVLMKECLKFNSRW